MSQPPDQSPAHGTAARNRQRGPLITISLVLAGATVAALGLEAFLIPNRLIDGGVVGVSIMAAALSGWAVGLFIFIFNLPFLLLGWRRLGRGFALHALIGISGLAVLTAALHHVPALTHQPFLAAVFGGGLVGMGVGLVIRAGGCLDGSEVVAILADTRSSFSTGETVMVINLFIMAAAGFVFGWDNALYSLVAYFVAYQALDRTVIGLDESKSAWIISSRSHAIGAAVKADMSREVTYLSGHSVQGEDTTIVYVVITRLEEMRLKAIVRRIDPAAFMTIGRLHEVVGRSHIDP